MVLTAIMICVAMAFMAFIIIRKSDKKEKDNQNPIVNQFLKSPLYAIGKNGFLGFVLGDSYGFVWNRIIHLNLMTQEEMEKEKNNLELTKMFGFGSLSIHAAKNKFDEIKEIVFCFDDEARLYHIIVHINNKEGQTYRSYMKEIRDKYSRLLGEPNNMDSETLYHWVFKRSAVMMYYDKDGITLHIQKP